MASSNCILGTLTGIGIFMSLFGSLMVAYWPTIFETILHEELALTKSSKSNGLWEVTPIPMFIEFYLFNWTNPGDLKKPGVKPIVEEIGPFVYREHRVKVVHRWNTENDTITFRQNRTWFFEPSLSKGKLDDEIITLNIPAITAAFACRNLGFLTKFMLNEAMNLLRTKYWVKKKAGEFIFDGYNDPLLDLAKIIPPALAPTSIPFDKFGWFYTRNGSADYDGIFNMKTGVSDIHQLGKLAEWDYMNHTHYYESYCGKVNGSAGELFPPDREKTKISLFSPDICRVLDLTYKEEVVVNNINAYRYWGDDKMFANLTQDPDNWCFCPSGHCPPHGALDVSTCKWGAPAFISFPHFYHADPWYREQVIGMNPIEAKHQMFIDLEPKSGIPVQVSAAFQINILLQPYKEYTILHDVPKIYFPAIWFRQTAHIDDKIGPELELLAALPGIGIISSLVMLSIGLTTVLVVGIIYLTRRCSKDDETFHGLVNE